MSARFALHVDLQELDATVGELRRCGEDLDTLVADLTRSLERLHLTWTGLAADAQADATRRWRTGYADLHDGLDHMRRAAAVAHENYTSAVDTNLRLWHSAD